MTLTFDKYQGTGNDFIIVNNTAGIYDNVSPSTIARLCDRHMGIGADGFIKIEKSDTSDFRMVYHNANGKLGSMCGNGGRCAVQFAYKQGIIGQTTSFDAVDGTHHARVNDATISLHINDVQGVDELEEGDCYLDTGSPHHIRWVSSVEDVDVVGLGRQIRHEVYGQAGSNVNFVEVNGTNRLKVRTYERGVENETLSCGTGVTAAALASLFSKKISGSPVKIETSGGELEVSFTVDATQTLFTNIYLTGAATYVYEGRISIPSS